MSAIECDNERWAAENGGSIEWARGMWWCDCPRCKAYCAEAHDEATR